MLGPLVALHRFGDGLGVGMDVWMPQLGELGAVPLASQNGVYNGQAGQSGNVTEDMVDLQVPENFPVFNFNGKFYLQGLTLAIESRV